MPNILDHDCDYELLETEEDAKSQLKGKTRAEYYQESKHSRPTRLLTPQEVALGISCDLWTAYQENLGRSAYAIL